MDGKDELTRARIVVDDDVGNEGAHQLLTRSHGHARSVPGSFEIFCKRGEIGRGRSRVRLLERRQARLTVLHTRKGCLPALLELRGDQTIIRVTGCVASLRKGG